MDSMLLILFFAIFPLSVILLIIFFTIRYRNIDSDKEREEKIIRATDKMRVQMLDSAVHELGNCAASLMPLFENIKLVMQQQGIVDQHINQDFSTISEQLERILETKYDASVFSQLVGDKSDFVNVNECIRSCWQIMRHDKRTNNVNVEMSLSNSLDVLNISSASLMSIIINLLSNSLDALSECKNNRSISIETLSSKGNIVIIISDSGKGMNQEVLQNVKTAYFTTKEKGKGTGLGLHIIDEIIKEVKGRFDIESKENIGTTISLYFPVSN